MARRARMPRGELGAAYSDCRDPLRSSDVECIVRNEDARNAYGNRDGAADEGLLPPLILVLELAKIAGLGVFELVVDGFDLLLDTLLALANLDAELLEGVARFGHE